MKNFWNHHPDYIFFLEYIAIFSGSMLVSGGVSLWSPLFNAKYWTLWASSSLAMAQPHTENTDCKKEDIPGIVIFLSLRIQTPAEKVFEPQKYTKTPSQEVFGCLGFCVFCILGTDVPRINKTISLFPDPWVHETDILTYLGTNWSIESNHSWRQIYI